MPTYYTILTNLGVTRLAEAVADNDPLVFTHLAVGDGGGAPITPDATMTSLVNERARVTINTVETSPDEPNIVRVEGLIPAGTGGFTIREAGLFNTAGELLAIASYPPISKPVPADGVSVEEYIRILIEYSNPTDAIALTVDTSVIIATRLYVNNQDDIVRAEFAAADAVIQDEVDSILDGDLSLKRLSVDGVGGAAATAPDGTVQVTSVAATGAAAPTPTFLRGVVYRDSVPLAMAHVDAFGNLYSGMNIASVSLSSPGIYVITLLVGASSANAIVCVATPGSLDYTVSAVANTATQITVHTKSGGVDSSGQFSLLVFGA